MIRRNEAFAALAIAAAALGPDFVSGRALAAFYGQTAGASWLGVVFAGAVFGLITGRISALARRTGSNDIAALLCRLPGGAAGRFVRILYGLLLLGAACMLLQDAAHVGALLIPAKPAPLLMAMLVLSLAAVLLLSRRGVLCCTAAVFMCCMLLFEHALLFAPEPPEIFHYELVLRLRENHGAALCFAMMHTAVGVCLSAGLAVRFADGRMRPGCMGACAGAAFGLLLAAGNTVLQARADELMALKLPFAALSGEWGSIGFYACACLMLAASVFGLTGILHALPAPNCGKK